MAKESYVVSVGAGKNQLPLIKRLADRGYDIISFDRDIDAPGKQLSDIFNNISTWNYYDAIQWLSTLNVKIKGVLCFSYGKALISQHKINEHYNINSKINNTFVGIMEDKNVQRRVLEDFGLSTMVEYTLYDNFVKIKEDKSFIIKDKVGGSSMDILLVNDKQNYGKIIWEMFNNDYIIQEYIDGIEYRIISLVKDKKAKFISVMERDNLKNTFFTGRLNPTDNYDKKIIFLIEKVIEKFELIDSALKIDVIQNENRIEILEIDFGIGGDYFETIISPSCYNYNFIDNYINLMLGLPVQKKRTLNNELCFDYIYNIDKKENLIVDYSKIFDIANNYFFEYNIVKIKEQRQLVQYPKSNMDAVFGIIHDRKDLSNYDVNILFNKALSK